jgi:long-subunit acyl-CoA synthetase (AMP-forming)
MKEYFKNPKATANYFYYDDNGIKWSRTGDIAIMNQNGEVFILGRASDFSMINNEKIYNFDIENSIRKLDFIQNVDVFTDNSGELVAHIILKDNFDNRVNLDIIDLVQETIFEDYNNINYIPCKFKFRESFPAAKNTKRDVAKMKAETEDFIYRDKSRFNNCKKLEKKIV